MTKLATAAATIGWLEIKNSRLATLNTFVMMILVGWFGSSSLLAITAVIGSLIIVGYTKIHILLAAYRKNSQSKEHKNLTLAILDTYYSIVKKMNISDIENLYKFLLLIIPATVALILIILTSFLLLMGKAEGNYYWIATITIASQMAILASISAKTNCEKILDFLEN